MKDLSREVRFVSRPNGASTHSNFEIAEVELQPLGSGEVRVRNTWMSVDPYMRGRMRDYESYLPPFQIEKLSKARPSVKLWNRMIQASRQVTLSCP